MKDRRWFLRSIKSFQGLLEYNVLLWYTIFLEKLCHPNQAQQSLKLSLLFLFLKRFFNFIIFQYKLPSLVASNLALLADGPKPARTDGLSYLHVFSVLHQAIIKAGGFQQNKSYQFAADPAGGSHGKSHGPTI